MDSVEVGIWDRMPPSVPVPSDPISLNQLGWKDAEKGLYLPSSHSHPLAGMGRNDFIEIQSSSREKCYKIRYLFAGAMALV